MKKLLLTLLFASVFALTGNLATNFVAEAEERVTPVLNSEVSDGEVWDVEEDFEDLASIEDNFDFHFVSTQNARRSDEFNYTWKLEDGAVRRIGNIDTQVTTNNIAIMSFVGDIYDDFELSVDFKAGSLTQFWPVIGIRQQIPGKYYTTEGGGAGVFMQQIGRITLWGPIVSGNVLSNLYEIDIPNVSEYYSLIWHNMFIRAEGSQITVWLDGEQVVSVTVNATDYSKGYVSLMSVNNDCSFDNFKIRKLGGNGNKGNEENLYANADLGQDLDDVIKNGYQGVKLPAVEDSETVGAPVVTPSTANVNPSESNDGLQFSVDYKNGTFTSLKLNGLEVSKANYERLGAVITLNADYVKKLPVGENVFTLVTDGGETTFTVNVEKRTVVFTDANRIKKFSTTDVSFKMDFGAGTLDKVTFGGAILPETAYGYENGALKIKRDFLNNLENGVYEVIVYDGEGTSVDCMVTVGVDTKDVLAINNDSFEITSNGYGQDLNTSTADGGLYGKGSKVVCDRSGTLLIIGKDNIDYAFEQGKTYSVTTYLKFDNTVDGTSSFLDLYMPIFFKTSSGNADIGYVRYSDSTGYYFSQESCCNASDFGKIGDWYRLYFEFTYNSTWESFEMPIWMKTTFTMDNFVLAPVSNGQEKSLPSSISITKNTTQDYVLTYTKGIIGINYNGKALTENDFTAVDGQLTLKKEFLSTLSAGGHDITVYSTNSFSKIIIDVNNYALSVSGDYHYALDGNSKVYTVQTDGFDLSTATVSDKNGVLIAEDYSVSGNELTLTGVYLDKIVGSSEITVSFNADAKVSFTVTSNKLFFVDFDKHFIDKGFAINMTQQTVTGKVGNGVKLTNTNGATMLALGGSFYDLDFVPGDYKFSFDLKIENIDTDTNFIIEGNSCYMPITFGSGKDVTYLRVTKSGSDYTVKNETQQLGTNSSVGEADANGFITIDFEFKITDDQTKTLTFDVWMPSTIVIDNLTLIKL